VPYWTRLEQGRQAMTEQEVKLNLDAFWERMRLRRIAEEKAAAEEAERQAAMQNVRAFPARKVNDGSGS
jgi:hypothetical protein